MLHDLAIYFTFFFLTLLVFFAIREVYTDMRESMSNRNPYQGHSF